MPNHITNIVHIESIYNDDYESDYDKQQKKMGKLVKDLKLDKGKFDFNGIIPMPKELTKTSAPPTVVSTQEEADKINEEHRQRWLKNDLEEANMVKAITEEEENRRTNEYGFAKRSTMKNIVPVLDWYEWSIKYWGTKWNSYEVMVIKDGQYSEILVKFETAWSPPLPVIKKIADKGFRVRLTWKDEGADAWHEWQDIQILTNPASIKE